MKNICLLLLFVFYGFLVEAQSSHKTENVVLITLDGYRWEEFFHGADLLLLDQQKNLKDPNVKEKFWRNDVHERRKALTPFIWSTFVENGQLYGNRLLGCKVNVTNNQWFSYPGYNEILTGKADNKRINSNEKIYNPNLNVLEFIHQQPGFKGKVAAFTSWDVFPYIINDKRSGVYVSSGAYPIAGDDLNDRENALNQLINCILNPLGDIRLDAFTFYFGLEYMKKNRPRVMYFAFDETDDFAHAGEYAAYLNAAHYTDRFIGELWQYLQNDSLYKDKTTIILTVDHGRGTNPENWKHHGKKIPDADQIWMAVMGPDSEALGEVTGDHQLYQNQIAKTLAAFLGLEYPDPDCGATVDQMMAGR